MWGQHNDTAPNDPEDWRFCRDCLRRDRDTGRCPVKGTYVAPWDNACECILRAAARGQGRGGQMTDWQDDLDDELWDGDGRDPMAEADAARPFDWDGPADGSWLEAWLCRECGAVFATVKGADPSFCPFCGAGEEG